MLMGHTSVLMWDGKTNIKSVPIESPFLIWNIPDKKGGLYCPHAQLPK